MELCYPLLSGSYLDLDPFARHAMGALAWLWAVTHTAPAVPPAGTSTPWRTADRSPTGTPTTEVVPNKMQRVSKEG